MELQVRETTEGLSLGVIVPNLAAGGGAERLALHCVRHWQGRHRITLYSKGFDLDLLEAFEISESVKRRELPERLWPRAPGHPADRLLEGALLPAAWSRLIEPHDVYLAHQWPMHRIERRPLVWYAHELHRPSYDMRRRRPEREIMGHVGGPFDPSGLRDDDRHEILHDFIQSLDAKVGADRVVANSRFTARQLERALGRSKVDVIYPGVDLDPAHSVAEAASPTNPPYFLSVGSLGPHKQHRPAIEALTLAADARLVIVGRGAFGADLHRMVARLGLEGRVEIREDVEDAELRGLYAGCRAVVFTPSEEPFGMVALEALAAGKPLLACDSGGFTEVVDAACAVIVPPEPAALAHAMKALLAKPEDAERMGAAGRKLAENFSWERTAGELEAVLVETHRSAVENGAPGSSVTAVAEATAPTATRLPEVGVRLRADFGDGIQEGEWRKLESPTPMPRHGFYASHHEATLRRHLAEIDDCGFDFVTLSMRVDDWNVIPQGIVTLRNALELAPELGRAARFAVELVLDGTPAALVDAALGWLANLADFGGWYRVDGRPLVLLRRNRPAAARESHPDLHVVALGEPHPSDPIRWLELGNEGEPDAALRSLLDTPRSSQPGLDAVIVSSWNDHPAGDALEETIDGDTDRRDAIRAVLRNR